jgi:hypothetical protein
MTNAFWMDDTSELLWFLELLKGAAESLVETKGTDWKECVDGMIDRIAGKSHLYCVCFSADPDLRNQWLEYADGGHGFAIGFRTDMFQLDPKLSIHGAADGPHRQIDFVSAIYDADEQRRLAAEVLNEFRVMPKGLPRDLANFLQGIAPWQKGIRCKNPHFSTEREWRLILSEDPGPGTVQFRTRAGRHLIPYVRYLFDPKQNPISQIWLGPRNDRDRNGDAVLHLLKTHDYDVERIGFIESSVPLHHW